MANKASQQILKDLQLEDGDFLQLMTEVIGLTEQLQNNPPMYNPKEELAADVVVKYLEPYSGANGPLKVRKLTYVPNRSNVVITYPGKTDKVISFVGCHLDVVPANPEEWKRNPFKLTREDDTLYGRGVTDCLGHVCLFTNFFKQLAVKKPELTHTIVGVFIANEEASDALGIGIDEMEVRGELAPLKTGPLYWVDSANFGPTLATGGMLAWKLTVDGKKFHSGVPHKGINAIELAAEVVKYLQQRFYKDFSKYEAEEKKYLFNVGCSMKPTQINTSGNSVNQIPGQCIVCGDIRHTPFWSSSEVSTLVEKYLKEMKVTDLPTLGPSKYHLPDENLTGAVRLEWMGHPYAGVAVKMDTIGYKAIHSAVAEACGKAAPFSLTGSLPIIRGLADAGYDVQITGFGRMDAYHANDEFSQLSDYRKGVRVVSHIISYLEEHDV